MSMKSLKIGTKLLGLTLLTVATGSGVSFYEARKLRSIDTTYSAVIDTDVNGALTIAAIDNNQEAIGRLLYRMIAEQTQEEMRKSRQEMEETFVQTAKLIEEPFRIDGRTIEVGASIGVVARTGNEEPMELLWRADVALCRAKENGKGHAVGYVPELDQERQRISDLEGELRQAINSGSVQPVFQPLVSASTGTVLGVEALARWQTSAGSISPEVFIPLAEKSGLIDALGMHMLRASIRHAKGWPGLALSVTALDIPVTAEGIENTHQAEILRQTGCDQFQGFLVGKPMSAAEIAVKLTQQGVAA
ncbi:EAL domain-containing protein [Agrobacterium salinitolerans]|uniref:EAL domain-containing protein n=1 Tax=Agrobacterium salinitolerans TaxID=1183413 RepID=A0ABY3BGU7_9HYPH|nr:EAL domain-containing protein [Agrobacterium salinitolerans]